MIELYQRYNMTFESEALSVFGLQLLKRSPEGDPSEWITVKLYYPSPNMIRVQANDRTIEPISILENNGEADVDTSICGSNKYFYFNYTIYFVITGNCMVRISLTNSIQLTARFAMDIDDFFIQDGRTLFIDRMVALLGIQDFSRVKIVGIYTGSVVVRAFIEESVTTDH